MAKKIRSGGGLTSNKLVRPKVRVGPPRTNVVSVAAVDMLGQQTAFKKPDLIRGTAPQVRMGNDLAQSCGQGPGGGRTLYGQGGSQGQHGKPAPGEGRMEGKADRGSRAILGPPNSKV